MLRQRPVLHDGEGLDTASAPGSRGVGLAYRGGLAEDVGASFGSSRTAPRPAPAAEFDLDRDGGGGDATPLRHENAAAAAAAAAYSAMRREHLVSYSGMTALSEAAGSSGGGSGPTTPAILMRDSQRTEESAGSSAAVTAEDDAEPALPTTPAILLRGSGRAEEPPAVAPRPTPPAPPSFGPRSVRVGKMLKALFATDVVKFRRYAAELNREGIDDEVVGELTLDDMAELFFGNQADAVLAVDWWLAPDDGEDLAPPQADHIQKLYGLFNEIDVEGTGAVSTSAVACRLLEVPDADPAAIAEAVSGRPESLAFSEFIGVVTEGGVLAACVGE